MGAIIAYPGCPDELNLTSIAETAAGLFTVPGETCYARVSSLGAGHTLFATRRGLHTAPHWAPPRIHGESIPFADAALELRGALETAVEERLARGGPTTVWMSGGWDSSAVFAAGMARSEQGTSRAMAPVSISYPPGDPGREDELIQLAAERWSSGVRWIQIDDIPFIDQPARRAALRDDPFAHAYEQWLRHLARGSRAAGSRVALGGYGGDQLFTTSDVYLADLLKSGRWRDLREEWRARNRPGVRDFLRWAVTPVLPVPLIRALESLRGGRAIHGTLEQPLPSWIRPEFAAREGIFERQRRHAPPRVYGVAAHHEMFWYLTHAYFPRVSSAVAGIATDEGVEVRSPLFDRRIVALAAGRPWPERAWRRERKSLLRAAMRGLLPDSFLAPRARKTGITSGYFRRSMEAELPGLLELAQGTMLLADLGIVDPEALRRAGERYLRGHAENLGVPVLLTIQTELWLRGRPGAAAKSGRIYPSLSRSYDLLCLRADRLSVRSSPRTYRRGRGQSTWGQEK